MYEVVLSKRFKKDYQKIVKKNQQVKKKVVKTLTLLTSNVNRPSLRLHKLSRLNNWSVSVTGDLRIIFQIDGNMILCTRIRTHDEVY